MPTGTFQDKLARLCSQVVLAEPEPDALAGLRARLEDLVTCAHAEDDRLAARAVELCRTFAGLSTGSEAEARSALGVLAAGLEELEDARLALRPSAGSHGGESRAGADPEILAHFVAHHLDELARMEELVVALEGGDDPQRARELSGMIHTLKGDSALVGQDEISRRCHELEDRLRDHAPAELADELLASIDAFRRAVAAAGGGSAALAAAPLMASESLQTGPVSAPAGGAACPRTVRVDATRLDLLVDRIGELVIAEAMLAGSPEWADSGSPRLRTRLARLGKITRELQGMSLSMRMVPVRATFQRMARLARDVAKKLDKEVEFVVNGAETELDKTVVDAIAEPLVHLVRNAVDHGVDAREKRARRGKPCTGRIELRAFHRGGNLWIELEDDGGGLDEQAILARARERGLVGADERPSSEVVRALIFEPGFSTAREVTDVSGRGIGLDVVQRAVQALRGRIEVRSQTGSGTTFAICLPLTMAIIDGMLVRAAGRRFVIPTLSILRLTRLESGNVTALLGRERVLRDGREFVPLRGLSRLLEGEPEPDVDPATRVVIVEREHERLGLLVDEILGQQQIVVKPLEGLCVARSGIAGGAILADGSVGLIVDVGALFECAIPPAGHARPA